MSKDIVLVTIGYRMSGVNRVENELVSEWQRKGHTISKISQRGKILSDSSVASSKTLDEQESKFAIVKYISRYRKLKKFFIEHEYAVIVALSLPATYFATILGLIIKNKIVLSERNDPAQYPESQFLRKIRDKCFGFADVCIFQTEDAMKYFPQKVQNNGIVIPNPINPDIPEYNNPEREKTIISAGRLKPQKNYHMLIRAFADFHNAYPDYNLDIYGDGYQLEELKLLASKLGVSSFVHFKGFTTDLFPEIAKSSMYVCSSNYEGISNAMLEAMAIGVPTICTDCPVGGARQMIQNGVNGLLVPVEDVKALSDAMRKVAGDDEYAEMLSKNAHKIREQYPIEIIAQRWIDAME